MTNKGSQTPCGGKWHPIVYQTAARAPGDGLRASSPTEVADPIFVGHLGLARFLNPIIQDDRISAATRRNSAIRYSDLIAKERTSLCVGTSIHHCALEMVVATSEHEDKINLPPRFPAIFRSHDLESAGSPSCCIGRPQWIGEIVSAGRIFGPSSDNRSMGRWLGADIS